LPREGTFVRGCLIFLPFFTLVGVQLNLPILAQSIAFGVLVFLVRGRISTQKQGSWPTWSLDQFRPLDMARDRV